MQTIKDFFKDTFVFDFIRILKQKNQIKEWKNGDWQNRGSRFQFKIPHLIKEQAVLYFARKYSLQTMIETGTFVGDMISACRNKFSKIYSIELSESLHEKAKLRFKRFKHITLLQGDSGVVIQQLMNDIHEPCLFWLDAHYSGGVTSRGEIDTPISQELDCILNHEVSGHVILIDDAHEFTGQNGYPKIEDLKSFVNITYPNHVFDVENNIIRILPTPNVKSSV